LPAPREVSLRRAILLMLGSALGYNTPKGLTSVAMASTIMPQATFPVAELLLIDQQGSMLVGSRSEFPLTIIDFWASCVWALQALFPVDANDARALCLAGVEHHCAECG